MITTKEKKKSDINSLTTLKSRMCKIFILFYSFGGQHVIIIFQCNFPVPMQIAIFCVYITNETKPKLDWIQVNNFAKLRSLPCLQVPTAGSCNTQSLSEGLSLQWVQSIFCSEGSKASGIETQSQSSLWWKKMVPSPHCIITIFCPPRTLITSNYYCHLMLPAGNHALERLITWHKKFQKVPSELRSARLACWMRYGHGNATKALEHLQV